MKRNLLIIAMTIAALPLYAQNKEARESHVALHALDSTPTVRVASDRIKQLDDCLKRAKWSSSNPSDGLI